MASHFIANGDVANISHVIFKPNTSFLDQLPFLANILWAFTNLSSNDDENTKSKMGTTNVSIN